MSSEGQRNSGGGAEDQDGLGATIPDAPDGVAAGSTPEPNTFEPEEAAPPGSADASGEGAEQEAE
jgi:hypothetical protein